MEQNFQLSFHWILDKTKEFDNITENNELQKETENSLLIDVYKFWQIGQTRTNTWSLNREAIVKRPNILESMIFLNSLRNQHCFDVKIWQVHDNKNIVSLTNLEAKILIKYQPIKHWFKEAVTSRIREAVF